MVHAEPDVTRAAIQAIANGAVSGLSPTLEVEVAERFCGVIPCAERVLFLKTGADAVSAAVRIARTYTNRDVVIGSGYFGWHDWWSDKPGVPKGTKQNYRPVPFDDVPALERAVAEAGSSLAAIVLEPVVEQLPSKEWIERARALCDKSGAVLVFDYGYPQEELWAPWRSTGTLLCFYRHTAHEDPFIRSELVLEFGGALSGEHGDGLVRSPFQQKMYGPALYGAFCELKRTFDPTGLFNPGKIVEAPPLTENLRFGPRYVTRAVETALDFSDFGSLSQAAEQCGGVGACRKKLSGTMCPSYRVTHDEQHVSEARGADAGLHP